MTLVENLQNFFQIQNLIVSGGLTWMIVNIVMFVLACVSLSWYGKFNNDPQECEQPMLSFLLGVGPAEIIFAVIGCGGFFFTQWLHATDRSTGLMNFILAGFIMLSVNVFIGFCLGVWGLNTFYFSGNEQDLRDCNADLYSQGSRMSLLWFFSNFFGMAAMIVLSVAACIYKPS